MAVDRLQLRRGEVVVDVGCGTGLNFEYVMDRVGPSGAVIGVDLSPDMLRVTRERVQRAGWPNVVLIESSAEAAELPQRADAALFSLTHDVMRSREALEKVIGQLKPGARISVLGAKWAPKWSFAINLFVWLVSRAYTTTFEGYDRPWSHLEELVTDLEVEPAVFGAWYIATARKQGA